MTPADTSLHRHAEWGVRGGSIGVEVCGAEVAELVAAILEDPRSMTDRSVSGAFSC